MRDSRGKESNKPNLWRGIQAGAIGGLVGSLAMNLVQRAAHEIFEAPTTPRVDGHPEKGPDFFHDSAAMKVGKRISRRVTGRRLSRKQKRIVEPIVHYVFGAISGAAYGAVAEYIPEVGAAGGIPFGAAFYLADEIGMPLLDLSGHPLEYPLWRHLDALGTHCLYGFATETVRRNLRGAACSRERDDRPEFGIA
jgi:putative membrane protein